MWGFSRPRVETYVERLRREYEELPKLAQCDKSERLRMLEKLVDELSRENETLRRRSGSSSYLQPAASAWAANPAPVTPYPITVAVKGSMFAHAESIQGHVVTMCPRVQWRTTTWATDGVANTLSDQSTPKCRVVFFRTGGRVSPTEIADLKAFCIAEANFVMFMHNEMSEAKKDRVGVEQYVTTQISSFDHSTSIASMAFKESMLYSTNDGLNAASLAQLVDFVQAQAPRV